MRKSIKYIALVIGSIMALIMFLVFISILSDYPTLNYKSTLIAPSLFFITLISFIISIIVLSFKFSNHKSIKRPAIVVLILFVCTIIFYFSGVFMNSVINSEKTVQKRCFDLTFSIPASWTEKRLDIDNTVHYYTPNSDFLMVSYSEVTMELDDDLFSMFIKPISEGIDFFKELEKGKREINNETFYYLKFSGNIEGEKICGEVNAFFDEDYVYSLSMVCKGDDFKYTQEITNILNSIDSTGRSSDLKILKTKIARDDFIKVFFEDIETLDMGFTYLSVKEFENEEKTQIINTYVITHEIPLGNEVSSQEKFHFSVYSDKDTGFIQTIDLMTDKNNYLNFSIIANIAALNIDATIDVEEFDKKYGLLPFFENDIVKEEQKFYVSKSVTENYLSVFLKIK